MVRENFHIKGLTQKQVLESRNLNGRNKLELKRDNRFLQAIKNLLREPMVILLLAASLVYFFMGKHEDGIFLALAIILVAAISLFQDFRSRIALEKLKKITQPYCKVIRDRLTLEINTEDVVLGDSLIVEEGVTIVADAVIVHSNDFSVNESVLTGESFPVYKDQTEGNNLIFSGTHVMGGLAIATVTAIGNLTEIGKIGKSLESMHSEKSPLELQINSFVKVMVLIGLIIFLVVWGISYFSTLSILESLLNALTLAMSILPEEIPVAFTTFMAMGAWRLMKMGVVVKHMKTVESLGSATVICVDKTGTITENKMTFEKLYTPSSSGIKSVHDKLTDEERKLITTAMWASEPIPFDPMEQAIQSVYLAETDTDERDNYRMIYEYPLGGHPPMMTHILENNDRVRIIAAKGAPETLLHLSNLNVIEKDNVNKRILELTRDGFRVLGVAEAKFDGYEWPKEQQSFNFSFIGVIAFYDPPKHNIAAVFEQFYNSGIDVKIITGDIAETAIAIAKEVGFKGHEKCMNGNEIMKMDDAELQSVVSETKIFTRMYPDAKLKIINALKAKGEIVAMTGDGINDGPALKASHIGIAMGIRGAEIAKESASLILIEDDLSKMVDAIGIGRRIYANLKKAIQYIISIHIPIIMTIFIPLALGWVYPNIFSPVHVILLELIMGPTCSIVYENEPMEKDSLFQKPREFTTKFFNRDELLTSVIQGMIITLGVLVTYQIAVNSGFNEQVTRAMVFTALITANIMLTFINRSFYHSFIFTIKYKNNLVPLIVSITLGITILMLYIKPVTQFFEFESPDLYQISISVVMGVLSVSWYELIKWRKRKSDQIILS